MNLANPATTNERIPSTPTTLPIRETQAPTMQYTTLPTLQAYILARQGSPFSILPPVTALTFEALSPEQIGQIGSRHRDFVVPVRLLLGHVDSSYAVPPRRRRQPSNHGGGGVSILTPTPPSRLNAMHADCPDLTTYHHPDNGSEPATNNDVNAAPTSGAPVYVYLLTRTSASPISMAAILLGSHVNGPHMTAACIPYIHFGPPFDRIVRAYAEPVHALNAIGSVSAYYFLAGRYVDGFWTRRQFGVVFERVCTRLGLVGQQRRAAGVEGQGQGQQGRDEDAATLVADEGYQSGQGASRRESEAETLWGDDAGWERGLRESMYRRFASTLRDEGEDERGSSRDDTRHETSTTYTQETQTTQDTQQEAQPAPNTTTITTTHTTTLTTTFPTTTTTIPPLPNPHPFPTTTTPAHHELDLYHQNAFLVAEINTLQHQLTQLQTERDRSAEAPHPSNDYNNGGGGDDSRSWRDRALFWRERAGFWRALVADRGVGDAAAAAAAAAAASAAEQV